MTRSARKLAALIGLAALLYGHALVAAYNCATGSAGQPLSAVANAAGISPSPCHGMDQVNPKLCEQHCLQDSQSVDTTPHSALDAPVLPLIAVLVQRDVRLPPWRHLDTALLQTLVDPPPLVRFGVLRI